MSDDPKMPEDPPPAVLAAIEVLRGHHGWASADLYRAIRHALRAPASRPEPARKAHPLEDPRFSPRDPDTLLTWF